jgi:hypothetical protein
MAQYQHLPIYKQTYDLLVRVTEITRGYPRDFKPFASKIREQVMEVVLLIYRANSVRAERARLLERIVELMQVIELSLRLSCDMRLITKVQFSSVVAMTDSVIRQASGWRKNAGAAE